MEERDIVYAVCTFNRDHNEYLDPDNEKFVEGVYRDLNKAKEAVIDFIKHNDPNGYDAEISVYDVGTGERINVIYFKHYWSDEVEDVYGKALSI